jgi:RND family efflux transporter MFP subunit
LAKSDLESLEKATLPLEIDELESKQIKARTMLETEKKNLEDTIELRKEGLVSASEVERQKIKLERSKKELERLEFREELTRKHLHPSALTRAHAKLDSAEQVLKQLKRQISNCTVTAPSDGMVTYQPLYLGNELRPVRVGDSIYQNQPFMMIPDLSDLIVDAQIPESELSNINVGDKVAVYPLAYPNVRLDGEVESLASMAQSVYDRPSWQKYFHVVIALKDADSRLRPGMSANLHVLSYEKDEALLIPRQAIRWKSNKPYCIVASGMGRKEMRQLTVGQADEINYEVISGVSAGEKVLLD